MRVLTTTLLMIIALSGYSQITAPTNLKWLNTDKITARTDTIVIDSTAQFKKNIVVNDTIFVGDDSIYNIDISGNTFNLNNQSITGVSGTYVTSIIAGTNITVSGATGDVTINASGSGAASDTSQRVVLSRSGATDTTFYFGTASMDSAITYALTNSDVYYIRNYSDTLVCGINWYVENVTYDLADAYVTGDTIFNINGGSGDFIVNGDADFANTHYLILCNAATTIDINFNYNKASNTNTDLFLFDNYPGNGSTIIINGKTESLSAGGNVINIDDLFFDVFITIKGGVYKSTAGSGIRYYTRVASGVIDYNLLDIQCQSIETTHGSLYALYLKPGQSNGGNISVKATTIKGVNAVYIEPSSSKCTITITIDAFITGNIYNYFSAVSYRTNISYYGKFLGTTSTFYVVGGNPASSINIFSELYYTNFITSGTGNGQTINIFGKIVLTSEVGTPTKYTIGSDVCVNIRGGVSLGSGNTNRIEFMSITAGVVTSFSHMHNWRDGATGVVEPARITVAGGKFVNRYIWDVENSANMGGDAMIKVTSGKVENTGVMNNQSPVDGSICIEWAGNGTHIPNGGRYITNTSFTSPSMTNAASTVTEINYNNWYSSQAATGSYSQEIDGGGYEIVDVNAE